MTTLSEFNELFREFVKTASPTPLRFNDIESYTNNVFRAVFGSQYVFTHGLLLRADDAIIFEDSPTGTSGVRAIGFKKDEFDKIVQDLLDLQKDPTLRLTVQESQDLWIAIIAGRQAQNRAIDIQNLEAQAEINEFFYNFTTPYGFSKVLKRIKNYIQKIKLAKDNGAYKTVLEFNDKLNKTIGSSFSILAWAGIYGTARKIWGKLPVLLGPCPLKHVDYIEIARSGKVLKFRATGSIFLAHQQGGTDAIKIEGVLYKAEFAFVMFMLWGLFIYGQSKFREMSEIPSISQITDPGSIRKLNDMLMVNSRLERPTYEFHQTFPFVNRHFIIPNCFIETISVEDKLPVKDTLRYSILIRTYEKPTEAVFITDKNAGTEVYGFKNKTRTAKICEYSLNAAWRLLNYSGWLIEDQEWKIGSAMEEGALDTYYDIDLTSLASIGYLNLIGAAT